MHKHLILLVTFILIMHSSSISYALRPMSSIHYTQPLARAIKDNHQEAVYPFDPHSLEDFNRFHYRRGAGFGSRIIWSDNPEWVRFYSDNYGIKFHQGVDIFEYVDTKGVIRSIPLGTPVYSLTSGLVILGSNNMTDCVKIQSDDGMLIYYNHIGSDIKSGTRVNKGDVIGFLHKSWGQNTPHLHIEVMYHKWDFNFDYPLIESPIDYNNIESGILHEGRYVAYLSDIGTERIDPFKVFPQLIRDASIEDDPTVTMEQLAKPENLSGKAKSLNNILKQIKASL
jgi:murein DD-endopeptidase MepM/ murein hydrolase activator NlpD